MKMPSFVSPMSGEELVAETKPTYWNYAGSILLGLVLLAFMGVGLLVWLWVLIEVETTHYLATNRRVVAKTGWLSTKLTEVMISDIRGINCNRTLWQRIIGAGDIAIGTAATEGVEIVMRGVVSPDDFIKAINAQR